MRNLVLLYTFLSCICLTTANPVLAQTLPITYSGSLFFNGGGTANYSITTDGVIGGVTPGDIIDFSITLNVRGNSIQITPANGDVEAQYGGSLTSTTQTLSFNFNDCCGSELLNFYFEGNNDGALVFGSDETLFGEVNGQSDSIRPPSGPMIIASVSPTVTMVPEPASLTLVGLPLAVLGLVTMRRRQGAAAA